MTSWKGKVVFMTGGSRGIGRAIALKFASEGATVAIAAKSTENNPGMPGTIHSVCEEINAAGGQGFPIQCDARDEQQLVQAIAQTADRFGGIDLLVNNAGYLGMTPLAGTSTKKFDLMHALNTRAPLITMREAMPHLAARKGGVLNLCPPLNLDPGWLGAFIPYTTTKYGMTLLSLGYAEEVAKKGITVRTLWPATLIATAAVGNFAGEAGLSVSRKPEIMADAAFELFDQPGLAQGQVSWLDEDILRKAGVDDLSTYAHDASKVEQIQRDFYVGPFKLN